MEDLERTPERTEVPESYFKIYLEGNARFPTFAFPFVVLIANEAISDPKFDPVSFALSQLTKKQIEELKHKVAHQHAHRTIPVAPAGYEEEVRTAIAKKHGRAPEDIHIKTLEDGYFQFVWRSYVNHAIAMIGALAGIRNDPKKWDIIDYPFVYNHRLDKVVEDKKLLPLATGVAWRLQEENIRMEVQNVFRSFANTLNGPYGKKKSSEIREVLDYSERGLPSDNKRYREDESKIRKLNEKLFQAMIGEYSLKVKDSDAVLGIKPPILTNKEIKAFRSTFVHP